AAPSRALAIVIHNTIIVVIVFMSLLLLLPVYPRRRGARDLVTIGCVMGSPRSSLWASAGPMKRWPTSHRHPARLLGNQAALEQFVGDRCRHAVEEFCPHLRIGPQELQRALLDLRLLPGRGLFFLLRQLLTGRGLVFLDDFLGDPLHDRERLLRPG